MRHISRHPFAARQSVTAEIRARLDAWGRCPDQRLDPVLAALDLAAVTTPTAQIEAARRHLDDLTAAARGLTGDPNRNRDRDSLERHASQLGGVLADGFGYRSHQPTMGGPQIKPLTRPRPEIGLLNAIETRRGSKLALALLFQHIAKATGMTAEVLAIPGDVLVRIAVKRSNGGPRLIVDPANRATVITPPQLRQRLKQANGARVELHPGHWADLGKRLTLLRLQNESRLDLLRQGRLTDALHLVHATQRVAPSHSNLWRDEALINVRLGRTEAAISAYETFIGRARDGQSRGESRLLLDHLRRRQSAGSSA